MLPDRHGGRSADATEIREAARLMRERAEAATPGPWEAMGRTVEQTAGDYADVIGNEVECMAYCHGGTPVLPKKADADFIASMHPVVALAVADWLDRFTDPVYCYGPVEYDAALNIARAYMGSESR